ncbi:hypothetical protein V6N13_100477 [Hibiscus sabdariffa]
MDSDQQAGKDGKSGKNITCHLNGSQMRKAVDAFLPTWNQIAREITTLERLTHLHFYFSNMDSFQHFLENSKSWKRNGRSFNFFVGEQGNIPASDFNVFECSAEKHLKFSRGGAKFSDAISVALKRATSFKLIGHTTARSLTDASELNLEAFTVEECQEMKSIANTTVSPASASGQPQLPKLQNLHIDNCERIENIIQAENSDDEVAFASLKEFQLSNLPRLSSICDASLEKMSRMDSTITEERNREGIFRIGQKKYPKSNSAVVAETPEATQKSNLLNRALPWIW